MQAATALNAALRDFTTFVLLENHSYIGLLYTESEKPPISFYLIRLTHKPPCVLIRIAFLGGTAGCIRHQVINELMHEVFRRSKHFTLAKYMAAYFYYNIVLFADCFRIEKTDSELNVPSATIAPKF